MVTQNNNLFRKKALEKLSSPEQLDQVMKVIYPMDWLPLTALGSLIAIGIIWSIVGRIPITVTGQGVLVYKSKVASVRSPAFGRLTAINVSVGDSVKKGIVLATIDQTELQKQLQQQRAKLVELESQNQNANSLQGQRNQQDRKNQIQEVKRNIAQLEVQLNQNGQIISQHNGRVSEVSASGQIVSPGTSIATIQAEEPGAKLIGLIFFPAAPGQKIRKGMKLQITPSSVERERFGGIVAIVTHVSPTPVTKEGAISAIGNASVVQSLIAKEPQIQVSASLQQESTFSTYKWSSSKGPQMKFSSGTTASVRVTTEERAPMSFIFPFLKSKTGVILQTGKI